MTASRRTLIARFPIKEVVPEANATSADSQLYHTSYVRADEGQPKFSGLHYSSRNRS